MLRNYFQEAIEFFFPTLAAPIDWSQPWEFLDKEFQQIAPAAETGKRYADQLVKVWLQSGDTAWILLHIEIQANADRRFAERMFIYHLRIFDLFGEHPLGLAILCDDNANWRPRYYRFWHPATRLYFRFSYAKLLDYRQNWSALEANENVFAVVAIAHLQAQATRPDAERKALKFSLIRQLYERGLERTTIQDLFRFVDWVMILEEQLASEFWQELREYEQERAMPYVTSVEKIGFARGLEQGERSLVLRQLIRRFGPIAPELHTQIEMLPVKPLEALGEALLDFQDLADLQQWLESSSSI